MVAGYRAQAAEGQWQRGHMGVISCVRMCVYECMCVHVFGSKAPEMQAQAGTHRGQI